MTGTKLSQALFLSSLAFLLFFTGCGSIQATQKPPPLQVAHTDQRSAPITLQVTRMDQVSQRPVPPRSWTITDAHAIQQLLAEIQKLPAHYNRGADTCARPHYAYSLDFWVGTKSLQKDELYTYCLTLTSADGSEYDPTAPFYALLTGMLHLSKNALLGW
jgi:hypothetical protein